MRADDTRSPIFYSLFCNVIIILGVVSYGFVCVAVKKKNVRKGIKEKSNKKSEISGKKTEKSYNHKLCHTTQKLRMLFMEK